MSTPSGFTYSAEEMARLRDCYSASGCGAERTQVIHARLERAANQYLWESEFIKSLPYGPRSERQKVWRSISDHAFQISQLLKMVDNEESVLPVVGQLNAYLGKDLTSSEFMLLWVRHADEMVELQHIDTRFGDLRERERAAIKFGIRVLQIWTELGGQLRISRSPETGKVQGPLSRFFRAATEPVMGKDAPSPESIRDLIRRYETLREGCRDFL